jgi:hypothetical protein
MDRPINSLRCRAPLYACFEIVSFPSDRMSSHDLSKLAQPGGYSRRYPIEIPFRIDYYVVCNYMN